MEKIPNESDSMVAAEQESGNKLHLTYDVLLMMSVAVVIGAVAVGIFITILS